MDNKKLANLLCAWLLAVCLVAPARAAETIDKVDLNALEGKVVVLDFWASWCVPCRRSFPWLNSMHDKYAADGLVIIGVNLDNEPADAAEFLADFPASFAIHYDRDKALAEQFEVMTMPSSYIIGRDGQVFKRHLGFQVREQDEYEGAIAAALAAKGETQ